MLCAYVHIAYNIATRTLTSKPGSNNAIIFRYLHMPGIITATSSRMAIPGVDLLCTIRIIIFAVEQPGGKKGQRRQRYMTAVPTSYPSLLSEAFLNEFLWFPQFRHHGLLFWPSMH